MRHARAVFRSEASHNFSRQVLRVHLPLTQLLLQVMNGVAGSVLVFQQEASLIAGIGPVHGPFTRHCLL